MTMADVLMLLSVICSLSLLLVNVVLIVAGYLYYVQCEGEEIPEFLGEIPFVSIMVPAHYSGYNDRGLSLCWVIEYSGWCLGHLCDIKSNGMELLDIDIYGEFDRGGC